MTAKNQKITREVLKNGAVYYTNENGQFHCEDGPAIEQADGTKEWWRNGQRHREDGPAVEWANGTKVWWRNDKVHREDGPAVEREDGTKEWYLHNLRHRDNGPTVEWANGIKEWHRNGQRHRDDGPAIDKADGRVEYWLNDQPWPEGPHVIAERKAQEERLKKEKEMQEALAHMKAVFNGDVAIETTTISRLKVKPKSKPPQP